MKESETNNLKVGRISAATLKALSVSITGELNVYIGQRRLDELAQDRPKSYLKFIEEVTKILKKPDFVCFDKEKEEFHYVRAYFLSGMFSFVFATVKRVDRVFQVGRVFRSPNLPSPYINEGAMFVRVGELGVSSK